MPKDFFVFYVDAQRNQRGYQSKHVATVVIRRPTGFTPNFQVGVAVKHQKDKLPFVKAEGRALALDRALKSLSIRPNLEDIIDEVNLNLFRNVKDHRVLGNINIARLNARIREVLGKFNPELKPKRGIKQFFINFFTLGGAL